MKKTLIAAAALSAMAASAMAANVTISGVVDLGLNFQNVKKTGQDRTNSFTMKSGQNSGSRVMFKGEEELGTGYAVGFQLESGFTADNGAMEEGRLFRRESRLYVKTPVGTIHAGRIGVMDAGTGSLSIFGGGDTTAFSTGWGSNTAKESAIFTGLTARYDNVVAYQSPTFAGATVYVAHSFKNTDFKNSADTDYNSVSTTGTEGKPSATRYTGVGVKYVNGNLNVAAVASQQDYASYANANQKNARVYSLGGGYNFGVCKVMLAGQYFDMGRSYYTQKGTDKIVGGIVNNKKGWGGILSATAPVAGGTLLASFGYRDAKNRELTNLKSKRYHGALGYTYNFSKRTFAYGAVSYSEDKDDQELTGATKKTKTTEAMLGLVHKF